MKHNGTKSTSTSHTWVRDADGNKLWPANPTNLTPAQIEAGSEILRRITGDGHTHSSSGLPPELPPILSFAERLEDFRKAAASDSLENVRREQTKWRDMVRRAQASEDMAEADLRQATNAIDRGSRTQQYASAKSYRLALAEFLDILDECIAARSTEESLKPREFAPKVPNGKKAYEPRSEWMSVLHQFVVSHPSGTRKQLVEWLDARPETARPDYILRVNRIVGMAVKKVGKRLTQDLNKAKRNLR